MTDQVNQTPVQIAATEATSMKNSYSFSDIMELTAPKVEAEEPTQEATSEAELIEAPTNTEEVAEEIKEEVEQQEEQPETEEKQEEVKEEDKDVKKIVAKFGEQEIAVPQDSLIPVTINGKEELIPLNELRSDYSGRTVISRKFTEINKKEQEFKKVDAFITKFYNTAISGDPIEAFEMLAEGTGMDPIELTKKIQQNVLKRYENYASMTEEERLVYDRQQEMELLDRKLAAKKGAYESERAVEAERQKLEKFQSSYNLDEATTVKYYQQLVDEGRNPESLKVEDLEEYHHDVVACTKALDVLGKLKPEWVENSEIVDVVANYARQNPAASREAVEQYVQRTFGVKPPVSAPKALQKKFEDKPIQKGLEKQTPVAKKPVFFSDL